MPTDLTFDQHLAGFHQAMTSFATYAGRAGLDVAVPTCPEWTVRRLIGHQGAVHRWAAASFRGEDPEWAPIEKAGRSSSDPVDWLRDGAIALVRTLVEAPEDAPAPVFLHDAGPPRRVLGAPAVPRDDGPRRRRARRPRSATTARRGDVGRRAEVALDGIDELLLGFVPRSRSRLRSPEPVTVAVLPSDAEHSFTVRVTDEPPVSTRVAGRAVRRPGRRGHRGPALPRAVAPHRRADLRHLAAVARQRGALRAETPERGARAA